jgi:hypothetical protein
MSAQRSEALSQSVTPATRDVPEDLLDANQFPQSDDWGYQSEPGLLQLLKRTTPGCRAVTTRRSPHVYRVPRPRRCERLSRR